MNEVAELTPYLVTALMGIVAWVGKRLHDKMDSVSEQLTENRITVSERLKGLEKDIAHLDVRMDELETSINR